MRNSIKYIFVLCLLCLVSSCVEKEFFEPAQKVEKDTHVVFTATPKGFTKTTVGTRAGEEEDDVEDGTFKVSRFENKIYNAYFMLFDNSGRLRIKEKATIDEEGAVSYNIGRDVLSIFPSFRICFIANVQESVLEDFVENSTTWSDLQTYYFDITYAPISETGCPGVPRKTDLNEDGIYEYAMPMFKSKVVNAPYNSAEEYYSIQLERMFARVEVLLSLGIQDDGNLLTSIPQFSLVECKFNNIPTQVPIVPQSEATACADLPNSDASSKLISESLNSYNLTTDLGRILYYSSETNKDYRSFYCYIPEHKLGNCGSNASQSDKPTLVEGTTKRPAYVSFSGFLVDRSGTSYDAKYNIYLGENHTDNFDLSRNKWYRNYVRINGVNSADHRVEKMDEVKEIIQDVTRTGMSANCYIIMTTGTYMLPAYKGAYSTLANAEMCDVGTNELIACDNPNIDITFNEALSKQSTIVFNVTNKSDLLSGNAVIARRNASGDIEWSWHLWFIPGIEWNAGSSGDLGSTNRIGGLLNSEMYDGTDMADRNLGVNASLTDVTTWLPSTIIGTYYKYGHRNPYIEDKKYGNGAAYHCLDNDDYEVWSGSSKSKTDPCPPGYRVPSADIWKGTNANNATNQHYDPLGFDVVAYRYWNNPAIQLIDQANDIMYPYTGYLDSSGTVQNGTGLEKTATTIDANDYTITVQTDEKPVGNIEYIGGSTIALIRYQTFSSSEYQYTQFKYNLKLNVTHSGYLWCLDKNYLYYSYGNTGNCDGLQIVSCMYRTREATHRKKSTRRYMWSSWGEWEDSILDFNQGNWSGYSELKSNQNNVVLEEGKTGSINNTNWQNALKSNEANRNIASAYPVPFTNVPSDGYQLRCVKE